MSPIYFLFFCWTRRVGRRGDRGRAFIKSRARVLPLSRAHHDRDGAETRTRASSINSFRVPINLNQKIIVLLVISQPMGSLSLFLRLSLSLSIHIVLRVLVRRPSFPRRASPGRQLRPEADATPRSSPVSAAAR